MAASRRFLLRSFDIAEEGEHLAAQLVGMLGKLGRGTKHIASSGVDASVLLVQVLA